MKIYFISKDANWQKYRKDVLEYFCEKHQHSVEILTTGDIKSEFLENNKISYKTFKSLFPQKFKIGFFPGAVYYTIKNRPDAVIALNNSTQLTEYLALIICRLFKIKFVWWTHAYDHKENKIQILNRIKEKYVLFFLKKANSIITFSEKGRQYLISKNISPGKVVTAPNTLNTKYILDVKDKLKANKLEIRKELGFNSDDQLVLFTGRLNKEKKVDHAIKACYILKNRLPNLKFIIIGSGVELGNLKLYSKELGLTNVLFLGEMYDELNLAKWFVISDLYLMPAYIGLGIIHAFCYDLPIITEVDENHGPELQYLKDGHNGYIVEKDNINALAEKIQNVLTDTLLRHQLSAAAFNVIKNEGSIDHMVSCMSDAFKLGNGNY